MMKWMAGVVIAAMAAAFVPDLAEAKRLGGGGSKGMQRSTPTQPAKTPDSPPAQQATPGAAAAPAAAGAAAAAGKRSWMGPLAGLAAGLGLAALFSAFGLGDEMASLLLIALLAFVAIFLVRRFLMRPAATPALAGAAAGAGGQVPMQRTAFQPQQPTPPTAAPGLSGIRIGSAIAAPQIPADFDRAGFERIAKAIFIRMQAANDAGDVNDLRQFTTPELFAELRLDLQERGAANQHTDVLDIQAEVIDFADEAERQVVSVRYRGRVQEESGAEPVAVDEVWHLVKPRDDSRNWAIAGIQQAQ
jgi:predicted lipid-binding transport protein (Tim44 family)